MLNQNLYIINIELIDLNDKDKLDIVLVLLNEYILIILCYIFLL